jgi:hypothetical protein
MTLVVYGVGGIKSGLEHDASRDFPRHVIIIVPGYDCCRGCAIVPKILLTKGVGVVGAYTRRTSGSLKLSGSLPFRAAGEPEHEPVVWVVLLGEVGREEES